MGLLLMQAMFAAAAGAGTGYNKSDAIDFDWENGHRQDVVVVFDPRFPDIVDTYNYRWYKVDMTPLYEEDNPVLALYLTNLEDQEVQVKIVAQLESQTEEREYTLPAEGFKIWSISAVTLKKMKTEFVWIQLTSDHEVALSAKVYENIRLDQTCTSSTLLNWAGTHQTAKSAWYVLDLKEAILASTQKVVLSFANPGSSSVRMTVSRSADCPSTGALTVDTLLAAGAEYKQEITRASLEVLSDSLQYIHVEANGAVDISAELETEDLSGQEIGGTATQFLFDVDNYLLANTPTLYYIPMSVLRVKRYEPLFVAENGSDAAGTISYKYAFNNPSTTSMMGEVNVAAHDDASVSFASNAIEAVSPDFPNVYFVVESSVPVTLRGRMRHIYEGASCKYTFLNDYEHHEKYVPDGELWYELPLEDPRALHRDVTFFIANHGTSAVTLKMERALECPFVVTEESEHTIDAGDTLRIVLPDGFNNTLKGDAIWYGLQAEKELDVWALMGEPNVKRPAVTLCESAQLFNWQTGHRQYAGDDKWYEVKIDTIRRTQSAPQLMVRNLTSAEVTYRMEISYECPDSLSNMVVEHTIPAYDRYLSASLRQQIVNMREDIDRLYVRMQSDGEIAVEVQFVRPEVGKNCMTAIPFNDVSGHDQQENEDLWYAIDIRKAKAEKKDVLMHVYNRSSEQNSLAAYLTDECPCDVPQYATYDMAPNEHRTREIVYSLLKNFGDTIYMRVKNKGIVHFEAELTQPKPIYIDACGEAEHLVSGESHEISKNDTLWFYLLPEDILSDNFSPVITFTDLGGKSTHQASVCFAFTCPVTEQMFERGEAIDVYSSKSIVLERTVVQSLAENDTIYLAFTANDRTSVVFDMSDPNTGEDCMHAIVMRDGDSTRVGKGVYWYRYDLLSMPEDVNAHLTFTGVKATDTVTCTMYNDCDGVVLRQYRDALTQNEEYTVTANKAWLSGFSKRYVLYKVKTTDSTDVKVRFTPMASTDTVLISENAIPMAINRDYQIAAGDTVWFWVNIANLRENTTDDVKWIIHNDTTFTANVQRATSWVSPTTFDLLPETVTVPARDSSVTVYSHAYLNALEDSVAYVRIISNQDVRVSMNVKMTRGEDCADPVTFDWENGNVHPAKEWIWYQVRIDSTKIPVDKDIRLNIVNLEDDETEASAHLFFDCRDESLANVNYTFHPKESRFKDIDRSLLKNLGWADMIIRYNSSNNTHISIGLVDSVAVPIVHDSVFAIVCNGEDYLDTITNELHPIDFYDMETRHWTDERDTLIKAFYEHRVTDFFITARIDPEPFTPAEMDAYKPILQEGMPIFVDSSMATIKRYFKSIESDSLALIDTIYWAVPVTDKKETALNLTTPIGRGTPSQDLRLVVKTLCGTVIRSDAPSFMIEPWRTDSVLLTDTICAGEYIVLQNGEQMIIERDTVIRDTVLNVYAVDTLQLQRMVDSVYVRNVRVRVKPELMPIDHEDAPLVVMQLGQGIDLTMQQNDLEFQYMPDEEDLDPIDEWVDSLAFERKIGDTFLPIDPLERLDSTAHEVVIRYVLFTDCQDTLYSPELTVIPQPYRRVSEQVNRILCKGDTVVPRLSEAFVLTHDTTFNDTVKWIIPTDSRGREITSQPAYDSVYMYDLHIRLTPELLPIDAAGVPQVTMQQGAAIDLNDQTAYLAGYYETDNWEYEWVDSIAFERKQDDVYVAIDPTERLDSTVREVSIRYALFTDCGDTLYSSDHTVTPLPYTRVSTTVQAALCMGDEYEPRLSPAFSMRQDTTFNDTVKWIIPADGGAAFDSIYVYEIVLLPATTSTTEVNVCRRDASYTWHVEGGDTTIMHADFENGPFTIVRTNHQGCDSVMTLVLHLLENTESTTEVTICGDDIPYTWHVEGGDTTISDLKGGTYTIVRTNADGCDSIMTLVLTINQPHYENLPIESHFGNRVLVINRASIEEETGWHVESSQVNWYKVGDPDELVREGMDYYTTGEPIVGTYYATIYTPAQQEGECSTYGRSITIQCAADANAPEAPEKEIRDGRLIIRRNGVLYTAEGLPLGE